MIDKFKFLSRNEKYRIANDTLYHMTFGEWRESTKAKIEFINEDSFALYYPQDNILLKFKRVKSGHNLDISSEEYIKDFRKRKESKGCEIR